MSQRNDGWLCPFWDKKGAVGQKKRRKNWFSSYLSCWIIAHTGSLEERIKNLSSFFFFDRTSSYYHHSPTPVLLGCCQSLGKPPPPSCCVWVHESLSFQWVLKKEKGRPLVCLLRGPAYPDGLGGPERARQSSRMTLTKLATSVSLESCMVKNGCCCIERRRKHSEMCSNNNLIMSFTSHVIVLVG